MNKLEEICNGLGVLEDHVVNAVHQLRKDKHYLTEERDRYKAAFEATFKLAHANGMDICPQGMPPRTRCPYAGETVPEEGCLKCHLEWAK